MFTLSGFADEISPQLDEQVTGLKKLGVGYLELRSINGKNVSDFTDEEAMGFQKTLRKNGLKVSAIGSPVGKTQISDPFEAAFAKFGRVLWMARIFETPLIRCFSFYIPGGKHAEYRSEVLRRMKVYVDEAAKAGCILQLENESGLYGESPEKCLDLLSAINSQNLRLTYDFANFVVKGYDTQKAWKILAPYTTYFHIKDAFHNPEKIVPAGEGEGHLKEILGQAEKEGYQGFASLEPHLGEARKDGGFSGESNFERAHKALVGILKNIGAKFN